ncbi:MAG: phage protein NinX family protein, partial [Caldilineaceae bacterium]
MKIKTQDLTGPALDWAVANIEYHSKHGVGLISSIVDGIWQQHSRHRYSTDWAKGGPIIEREELYVQPTGAAKWKSYRWLNVEGGPIIEREELYVQPTGDAAKWKSYRWLNVEGGGFTREYYGPTPLIAAMCCYVASKLGGEVDVP